MSPTAKAELQAYAKRIRRESKQRDRQFAPRNADTGFAVGVLLGLVGFVLIYLAWRFV